MPESTTHEKKRLTTTYYLSTDNLDFILYFVHVTNAMVFVLVDCPVSNEEGNSAAPICISDGVNDEVSISDTLPFQLRNIHLK